VDREEERPGTRAPIEIRLGGRTIYRGMAYFNSGLRAEGREPFIIIPKEVAEKAGIQIKGLTEAEGFTISYLGETDTYVDVRVKSGEIASKWVRAKVYVDPFKEEPFVNTTLCNMLGIKFLDWDEGIWFLEDSLPERLKGLMEELYRLARKYKRLG